MAVAAASDALGILRQSLPNFEADLMRLGATSITSAGKRAVDIHFSVAEQFATASTALRDSVKGVELRLHYDGPGKPRVPAGVNELFAALHSLDGVTAMDRGREYTYTFITAGNKARAEELGAYIDSAPDVHGILADPRRITVWFDHEMPKRGGDLRDRPWGVR